MIEAPPIHVECDVPVPMRDGTVLFADVYRQGGDAAPVLLCRTPYDKSNRAQVNGTLDVLRAVRAGYIVVVQDVRGRYASGGRFDAMRNEAADGYDSVEWCAAQAWSSGKVGMYGRSYYGLTAWQAALARPPHLAAIVPVITASDYHDGWTYQGGAFCLGFNLSWTLPILATETLWRRRDEIPNFDAVWADHLAAIDSTRCHFWDLPLAEQPTLKVEDCAPYYFDWLAHPDYDDFWRQIDVEAGYDRIGVPALNVGGWYDIFLGGTLRNYLGVRQKGETEATRAGQRLLIGPWAHQTPLTNTVGAVDFGYATLQNRFGFDQDAVLLRFFDRWLKGIANGVDDEPPVRIFVMGENVWRSENEWPLARARNQAYYLHSGGRANSRRGDGGLSREKPSSESTDSYLYDPRDPVPTNGGGLCCWAAAVPPGAYDQSAVEERPDVLVYSTPPLESDLEVTGPISVTLFASSSAVDTDFTAKLVDVSPEGFARNLTDGIIRARYRANRERPSPIEPGQVYEYRIDLWATSNLFKAGHRIRLEISSSNFPRFDRNPNTGAPFGRSAELQPALQTVFHDADRPSRIILPVVPR